MQLHVKGKNVEVSDSIREYAESKLRKLERQLADPTKVELELTVEKNPSIAASHVAEATIWTKGPTLRARESASDVRASIDLLVDKLERQVTRYREKRHRHGHHQHARANGAAPALDATPVVAGEEGPLIVKTKQFTVKPMSAEEAVLQLELVGHDFFVFRSDETDEVNVVYRRADGNYGLIEPQAA
jgi:putative sigma-54 modulation protein